MTIKLKTTDEPTLGGFVHWTDAQVLSAYPKRLEGLAPCSFIETRYARSLINEALAVKYGLNIQSDATMPSRLPINHDGRLQDNEDIKDHLTDSYRVSISLLSAIAKAEGNTAAFEFVETWKSNPIDEGSYYWLYWYDGETPELIFPPQVRTIKLNSTDKLVSFARAILLTANAAEPSLITRRSAYVKAIEAILEKQKSGLPISKTEQFSLDFDDHFGPQPRGIFEQEHERDLWRLVRETKELKAIHSRTGKTVEIPEQGMAFGYDSVDPKMRRHLLLSIEDFKKFAATYQIKVVIEDEPEAVAVSSKTAKITDKGQPWTEEKIKVIAAYRAENGTQKAAEHFGISTALIRKKLPNEKPNESSSSPFGNMAKTFKG
jgi:hypothetical protein